VVITVKSSDERFSIKWTVHVRNSIWCDDSLVEDFEAGQGRIKIDVGCQDEMLIIVFAILPKLHQVVCRSDLIGIIWLSSPTAVFGENTKG
jgi:hypothetical protein